MRGISLGAAALGAAVAAALAAGGAGAGTPSSGEQAALADLDAAIDGMIFFTKGRTVYRVTIGVDTNLDGIWDAVAMGSGDYVRVSPDGTKLAVYYGTGGNIYVMSATGDGTDRQLVLSGIGAASGEIPNIEFHPNGHEIVFSQGGLKAVDVTSPNPSNPVLRLLAGYHRYDGEPGMAISGKRAAARDGHDLYAIVIEAAETTWRRDRLYMTGCSAGVSPDGSRLMNNNDAHDTLTLRDWDGSFPLTLSAATCQPEEKWDNHHWSNHPNYIAIQGDGIRECYVLDIAQNKGVRITWTGGVLCPDLWVAGVVRIAGSLSLASGAKVCGARVIAKNTLTSKEYSTLTDDDGEFTILGLMPDGDYELSGPGLSPDPLGTVTVTGGVVSGDTNFTVTETNADSDNLPDWWELRHFGDLATSDGSGDQDSDGTSDYEEYLARTSPTVANAGGSDGGGGCAPGAVAGGLGAALALGAAVAALASRKRS